MIADYIISYAKQWVGEKEIQPNNGFENPALDKLMRENTPFQNGYAWCACFAILCWTKAYGASPDLLARFKKLQSANSQQMARNFHADQVWPTSTTAPKLGAMVIFGDVGSDVSGHTAACIISIDGDRYTSIEGNVNDKVSIVNHIVGAPHPVTGLEFIRFIYPMEPSESVAAPDNKDQQQIIAPTENTFATTKVTVSLVPQPSKINQILTLFKNINIMSGSWKTTLFGALAVLPQILPILFPKTVTPAIATSLSILFAGAGLTVSKDSNVTGGTTPNPVNDASVVCTNTTVDSGLAEKTS